MTDANAPAASYTIIADYLGETWFTAPSASQGYRLEITSLDGVVTVWELNPIWARNVIAFAKSHPHLAVVNIRGFIHEGDAAITTWHAGA